jgi:hypothetical protein
LKKLLFLLILGSAFGLGYWVGQNPNEAKHIIREYSGEVVEKTIGLQEGMALRREYLGAKERLVEAKGYFLDREYKKAADELDESLDYLQGMAEANSDVISEDAIDEVMVQVRGVQRQLEDGRGVSRQTWDYMQRSLDNLVH